MTWSRMPAIGMFIAAGADFLVVALFAVLVLTGIAGPGATALVIVGAILGLSGIVFVLLGFRMLRRYQEAQRLRTEGVPGQGQVLSMEQTGMYMNKQPKIRIQMRVTTPVHGTYDHTVAEYVPLMALGLLTSGVPLTVRVDREDRTKLVIEWSAAPAPTHPVVPAASLHQMMPPNGFQAPPAPPLDGDSVKQRLLISGIPATATVLAVSYTGQLDHRGWPIYDLHLHIQLPGQPAAAGPARSGIPPQHVSSMQVGATIPVRVEETNPAVMAADWDR